ncbi:hypothetical protein [Agrococcus jejuensis]|nr:hypothetical protein [Agrococcus jejuensis]
MIVVVGPLPVATPGPGVGFMCSVELAAADICPDSMVGELVVGGSQTTPGGGGASITPVDEEAADRAWRSYLQMLYERCVAMAEDQSQCVPPPGDPVETAADDAVPPITIDDLVGFTPGVGELVVQPENWGVLGIPTNFVATATDHVQHGTLLGQPIEVRWRPVSFTFDYGDGSVVATTDAGAMWQSSGDDWTTTSTSHEYSERGEYTATVTITFEADIATGTGWATVPGTLELAAPAEGVQVFEVQTVLTRGDCIDYPNDPGCSP